MVIYDSSVTKGVDGDEVWQLALSEDDRDELALALVLQADVVGHLWRVSGLHLRTIGFYFWLS